MNSLNILSAISSTPPHTPRTGSFSRLPSAPSDGAGDNTDSPQGELSAKEETKSEDEHKPESRGGDLDAQMHIGEQTPLLGGGQREQITDIKTSGTWKSLPGRVSTFVLGAVKVVVAWIIAPGQYLIACFFDDGGRFSPFWPITSAARALNPRRKKKSTQGMESLGGSDSESNGSGEHAFAVRTEKKGKRSPSLSSTTSTISDLDEKVSSAYDDSPAKHTRSRSSVSPPGEEIATSRRSIRIKLHNDEALNRRRKLQDENKPSVSKEADAKELVAASLKSPNGPSALKITKFPKAPLPPRPLVPRRQPSFSKLLQTPSPHRKTLVIDLDETLIHSHSKGGRFATGHMVEVKIAHAVGVNGVTIGPQVPILYYVHKRPHCDEFLRKIHKWYKLVIFTASVQEYADPVIDWLEMERSYFDARYYRQHCTFRNGAYIKDLSQVEPDLSKVMILDNSPVSYIFHEDNAIPIEGWISDPTDNDLLHLIPLLEGLQYATDVRALLALRLGQPQGEAA